MSRQLFLVAVLGLIASACISADPPPADTDPVVVAPVTTMPEDPLEPVDAATVALVEDYWEARDQAWASGVEAGLAFTVANNHPLLPYSADQCREAWFDGTPPVGFAERNALASETIVSDPGFVMSVGPLAGRELGEGLLRMVVAFAYEGQDLRVADRVAEVHLQVIDDQVRHFLLCRPVEVTVVAESAGAAAGSATGTAAGGTTVTTGTGTATGTGTGTTTGTGTILGDPVTVLPPITAVPVPVPVPPGGTGGGTGTGTTPPAPPPPPGTRPIGSGIDFCDSGSPGAQPVAGDYFLCPDDDVDPNATPAPAPAARPSDDVTRG